MPILKHAKKKLRQDKKRVLRNKTLRNLYKSAVKAAKASPTDENLKKAFSEIDKAAKNYIIHANKAARLKSSLSKIKEKGTASDSPTKPTAKKSVTKKKTSPKASASRKTTSKKK